MSALRFIAWRCSTASAFERKQASPGLVGGYRQTWSVASVKMNGLACVSSCPAQRGRGTALRSRAVEGASAMRSSLFEASDRRGRQSAGILTEQGAERVLEITGGDAPEVEDRDQNFEALRPPRVGRQDR